MPFTKSSHEDWIGQLLFEKRTHKKTGDKWRDGERDWRGLTLWKGSQVGCAGDGAFDVQVGEGASDEATWEGEDLFFAR